MWKGNKRTLNSQISKNHNFLTQTRSTTAKRTLVEKKAILTIGSWLIQKRKQPVVKKGQATIMKEIR